MANIWRLFGLREKKTLTFSKREVKNNHNMIDKYQC